MRGRPAAALSGGGGSPAASLNFALPSAQSSANGLTCSAAAGLVYTRNRRPREPAWGRGRDPATSGETHEGPGGKATFFASLGRGPAARPRARCGAGRRAERWLLAASAKIQVPFYPVPMTLQTLAVLGDRRRLRRPAGRRRRSLLYLAEGPLRSLPVFAGVGGRPPLHGRDRRPAISRLPCRRGAGRLGSPSAAGIATWGGLIGAMAIGHVVIFAFGFAWLALLRSGPRRLGRSASRRSTRRRWSRRCPCRGAGRGDPRRFTVRLSEERPERARFRPDAADAASGPLGREAFARFAPVTTRWSDSDPYGHLNNVAYYAFFDAAVNAILIEAGLLDPADEPGDRAGRAQRVPFFSSLAFPDGSRSASRWSISAARRCAISSPRSRPARRAPARKGATPMSMSTARPAGRRDPHAHRRLMESPGAPIGLARGVPGGQSGGPAQR